MFSRQKVKRLCSAPDQWRTIQSTFKRWADTLGQDIVVEEPSYEPPETEPSETTTVICLFSAPLESHLVYLDDVYGLGQPCSALRPVGSLPIIYDNQGVAVAQVDYHCLYILIDLDDLNARTTLNCLWHDYRLFLSDRERFDAEMVARTHVNETEQVSVLVDMLRQTIENLDVNVWKETNDVRRDIQRQERHLADLVRYHATLINLHTHRDNNIPDETFINTQLEQIKGMAVDHQVTLTKHELRVNIGPILVEYKRKTYYIGDFTIIICFDYDDPLVLAVNTTNPVENYHHPHVHRSGNICLGNISVPVAKLVGRMEYASVIAIITDFLKTVNDDNWYCHIEHWPEIDNPRTTPQE